MAIKSVATPSGKTIKVELVRFVQDKIANLDGDKFVTGREIVEYTKIWFYDQAGKLLTSGNELRTLHPKLHADMIAKGAVARIGDAYVPQQVVDLVSAALAELEAENPKSDEQLEIERRQAAAAEAARLAANSPERLAHEAFARRMDDPNSDL